MWLPRNGAPLGEPTLGSVASLFGLGATPASDAVELGEDLWETPTYSASGEDVSGGTPEEGLYAWVAGEFRTVARVRRVLVDEVGLPRRQVAFVGYWRQGVAMRG